jgi:hypothetical protein
MNKAQESDTKKHDAHEDGIGLVTISIKIDERNIDMGYQST